MGSGDRVIAGSLRVEEDEECEDVRVEVQRVPEQCFELVDDAVPVGVWVKLLGTEVIVAEDLVLAVGAERLRERALEEAGA
jgi:hypothetical protein